MPGMSAGGGQGPGGTMEVPMLAGEDLVHRLGLDGNDRPDLVAVDRLGDVRRTVTHEAADLLDRHPVVGTGRETKVCLVFANLVFGGIRVAIGLP